MVTPTGARHRDLEQRLRDLEDGLRTLTGATLRRRQMGVTEGDFVVSGGGSVIVKDGGGLEARYTDDQAAAYFGPLVTGGGNAAQGIAVRASDGAWVFGGYHDQVNGERVMMGGADATPLRLYQVVAQEYLAYGANGESYWWLNTQGDAQVQLAAGRNFFLINHPTTAAGANCHITTSGAIMRSTSSRRYKTAVRIPRIDVQAVLALQPKAYQTRAEVAEQGKDAAPEYVGFVAEDAAELGLEHWVTRDEQGRPDAFNYAQWCVAQQAVLQDHQARISDLEAENTSLRDQLATLTARLDAAGI